MFMYILCSIEGAQRGVQWERSKSRETCAPQQHNLQTETYGLLLLYFYVCVPSAPTVSQNIPYLPAGRVLMNRKRNASPVVAIVLLCCYVAHLCLNPPLVGACRRQRPLHRVLADLKPPKKPKRNEGVTLDKTDGDIIAYIGILYFSCQRRVATTGAELSSHVLPGLLLKKRRDPQDSTQLGGMLPGRDSKGDPKVPPAGSRYRPIAFSGDPCITVIELYNR